MIAHIRGRLTYKSPEYIVVDVAGVGYRIFIPLSTYYRLPAQGEVVELQTYTHVREEALQLYGFLTTEEKDLFEQLLRVSKVGPRLARNIISGLPITELRQAIIEKDILAISSIPGVGRKMAERLVMELRDRLMQAAKAKEPAPALGIPAAQTLNDAVSALVNLGYKQEVARRVVKKSWQELGEDESLEELIKYSLRNLANLRPQK